MTDNIITQNYIKKNKKTYNWGKKKKGKKTTQQTKDWVKAKLLKLGVNSCAPEGFGETSQIIQLFLHMQLIDAT